MNHFLIIFNNALCDASNKELLDDYGMYNYPAWFISLAEKYEVPQDFFTKKDSTRPGFHVKYELR